MSVGQGRRALAALGLSVALGATVTWSLGFAAPAHAHEPAVAVVFEELDGTPVNGTVRESRDFVIHGQASHPEVPPVEQVELRLGAPDLSDRCEVATYEPVPAGEATDFRRPLLAPDCNGTWTIAATAITGDDQAFGHGRTEAVATAVFELAIPPSDPIGVTATATGDDGGDDRSVTLGWLANDEPDLVGYRIDRAEPNRGFRLLTVVAPSAEPVLVDDDLASGGDHRYRVYAVRTGVTPADADLVTSLGFGSASVEVAQPPPTTTTTAGEQTTTSSGVVPTGRAASRPGPRPSSGSRTITTSDTGFGQTLPFDPSQTTLPEQAAAPPPPPSIAEPSTDGAVVALQDDGAGEDDPRTLLVPVAGSLALFVVAAHARHVVRRATEHEELIPPL